MIISLSPFEFFYLLRNKRVAIHPLTSLSHQKVEVVVQRPTSPVEDRKGKQVLEEPEGVLKAEK